MKKNVFKALRFFLFLSIAVILLYFAFRGVDLEELWKSFASAKYVYILVYLAFGFISLLSRAFRWTLLVEALGYKTSFLNSFYSLNTGYMANYAFPRLGEITRCASLSKAEKIPVDKLIGTVIVERVVDLMSVAILTVLLVAFRFDFFGAWLNENIFDPMLIKVNQSIEVLWIILVILLGIPIAFLAIYYLFRSKLTGVNFIQKIKSVVKGIIDGLKTMYTLKRRWLFLLHTLLIWLFYWAMTYGAVFVLPETSILKPIDGLFLLIVGSFGFILPAQGGIGAYHLITTLGLTLYSIPREAGLTYATITHGAQMIMLILMGAVSFMILFSFGRKSRRKEAVLHAKNQDETA